MKFRVQEWKDGNGEVFYTVQKKHMKWKDVWFDEFEYPTVWEDPNAMVCQVGSLERAEELLNSCLKSIKARQKIPVKAWFEREV